MKTILLATLVSFLPLTALAQVEPVRTPGESYEDYWDMDMSFQADSPRSPSILGNGNVLLGVECVDDSCESFTIYDILPMSVETEMVELHAFMDGWLYELGDDGQYGFYRPSPCGDGLMCGAMCTNEITSGAQRPDDGLIAVVFLLRAHRAQSLDVAVIDDCLDDGVFNYTRGGLEFEQTLPGELVDASTCEAAMSGARRIQPTYTER